MQRLGISPQPVLKATGGMPQWPDGIVGSLAIVQLSKFIKPALLIPICGLVFGFGLVALGLIPVLIVVLLLIPLAGMAAVGFFVSQLTLLQTSVANEYQGRIFGAFGTLQAIAMLVGMGLASGLGDSLGIVPLFLVDAFCNILAACLAFVLLQTAQRRGSATTTDTRAETNADNIPVQDSASASMGPEFDCSSSYPVDLPAQR